MSLDDFFHAETSARPIGVARAAIGIAALIRAALQYEILRALLSGDVIRAKQFNWFPDLRFDLLWPFMAIWMLASVSFALGFRSRVSGSVLFLCLAYQLAWDENLQANNFYLMTLIVFLLTVADSGCSFSLDRRLFRRGPQVVVRWSTLLPRLQISIVYFYSALLKLNPSFLAGRSITKSTRMPELLHHTWLPSGVAAATVGVEFFLAVALWLPALRRGAFALGFLLHLGIFLGMDGQHTVAMFTFGVTMCAPYLLFLEDSPASRLVIWDDSCALCRRWVAFFQGFDWLKIHSYEGSSNSNVLREAKISPQDADVELKLWWEGRTLGGFDAVREILCLLPISFLWAPLLAVPPVPAIGRRLYQLVAERRKCTVRTAAPREL